MTAFVHGRLALVSMDARPAERGARISEARLQVKKLDREYDRWAGAVARLVEAGVHDAEGRRDDAIRSLREGVARLELTGTLIYALPARYRLGKALGGEEGEALVAAAEKELAAHGVKDPARWADCFVPGSWGRQ
jgi:hypothetical protein